MNKLNTPFISSMTYHCVPHQLSIVRRRRGSIALPYRTAATHGGTTLGSSGSTEFPQQKVSLGCRVEGLLVEFQGPHNSDMSFTSVNRWKRCHSHSHAQSKLAGLIALNIIFFPLTLHLELPPVCQHAGVMGLHVAVRAGIPCRKVSTDVLRANAGRRL
jgi:hypothetical protein